MLKLWKVTLRPFDPELGGKFTVYAISETADGGMKSAKKQGDRILHEMAWTPGDLETTEIKSRCGLEGLERVSFDNNLVWDATPYIPSLAGNTELNMWEVSLSSDKPHMAFPLKVNVVAGDVQTAMAHAKRVAESEFDYYIENNVRYTPHSAVLVAHRVQVARKEDA